MSERLIPLAAMEQILKKCGANRVSEDAKIALKDLLENYACKIGTEANKFALHAKRKTIKKSDIDLACNT